MNAALQAQSSLLVIRLLSTVTAFHTIPIDNSGAFWDNRAHLRSPLRSRGAQPRRPQRPRADRGGPRRQDRRRHRAEPDLLRLRGRLLRHRADGAQGRRAADRLVLSALARHPQDARRNGCRHRHRRGPVPGPAALVRRAVSRAPGHAPPLRAQDARPPGRADGGQGGPAGLRADAPGARAARPPGQGHQQHLHKRIALRARRARLPDAARQRRPRRRRRNCARPRPPTRASGSWRSPASPPGSPRRSSTNSSWTCRCRRCT